MPISFCAKGRLWRLLPAVRLPVLRLLPPAPGLLSLFLKWLDTSAMLLQMARFLMMVVATHAVAQRLVRLPLSRIFDSLVAGVLTGSSQPLQDIGVRGRPILVRGAMALFGLTARDILLFLLSPLGLNHREGCIVAGFLLMAIATAASMATLLRRVIAWLPEAVAELVS